MFNRNLPDLKKLKFSGDHIYFENLMRKTIIYTELVVLNGSDSKRIHTGAAKQR
jgi:hypothetical protein